MVGVYQYEYTLVISDTPIRLRRVSSMTVWLYVCYTCVTYVTFLCMLCMGYLRANIMSYVYVMASYLTFSTSDLVSETLLSNGSTPFGDPKTSRFVSERSIRLLVHWSSRAPKDQGLAPSSIQDTPVPWKTLFPWTSTFTATLMIMH